MIISKDSVFVISWTSLNYKLLLKKNFFWVIEWYLQILLRIIKKKWKLRNEYLTIFILLLLLKYCLRIHKKYQIIENINIRKKVLYRFSCVSWVYMLLFSERNTFIWCRKNGTFRVILTIGVRGRLYFINLLHSYCHVSTLLLFIYFIDSFYI